MPLNGSGVATPPGANYPAVSLALITAANRNGVDADVYTILSTALYKDGQQTPTANIPLGGFKLTGVGAASARTDAATLATIQDGTGVYVGTVGGTANAITLTPSPAITALVAGQAFYWIASGANTGAVTLQVSGLASPPAVTKNGTTALVTGDIPSGALIGARYDGTRFQLITTGAASAPGGPFVDTSPVVVGSGDATKKIRFEVDGLTTATTRVITVPDSDITLSTSIITTAPRILENAGLSIALAANAVTIALKGADGNDPSASNAVGIGFRSATITTGQASKVSVVAALSTVISSGSTGGTISAQASRIWIGALLTGGAAELCWFQALSGTSIAPINEGGLISTTAEGGAGAADSAQTWYSTTARASVPVTILGYFDSTQTTAGTWAQAITSLIVNPRYRPGDLVQQYINSTGAVATGTTAIPNDDTIPQNTEGDQYLATTSMTPLSGANVLRASFSIAAITSSAAEVISYAIFRDSTAAAIASKIDRIVSVANMLAGDINVVTIAGSTSATQFKLRAGAQAASTTTFNGTGGGRIHGGVLASSALIEEIMA